MVYIFSQQIDIRSCREFFCDKSSIFNLYLLLIIRLKFQLNPKFVHYRESHIYYRRDRSYHTAFASFVKQSLSAQVVPIRKWLITNIYIQYIKKAIYILRTLSLFKYSTTYIPRVQAENLSVELFPSSANLLNLIIVIIAWQPVPSFSSSPYGSSSWRWIRRCMCSWATSQSCSLFGFHKTCISRGKYSLGDNDDILSTACRILYIV